jgi:hypothetical protein
VVRDVSSEFDSDLDKERKWKNDVRDKNNWKNELLCDPQDTKGIHTTVDMKRSPSTALVSLQTQMSVIAARAPCKTLGRAIYKVELHPVHR